MSYNKDKETLVSVVMNKDQVDKLDEIKVKLDIKRGYIIRRFVDEGMEKYHSNNKQLVGSDLDPMTIS